MSVFLYGRASFCTVVRRADDAAPVRELPYRISVQYSYSYEYSVSDYGTRTSTVPYSSRLCFEMGWGLGGDSPIS